MLSKYAAIVQSLRSDPVASTKIATFLFGYWKFYSGVQCFQDTTAKASIL